MYYTLQTNTIIMHSTACLIIKCYIVPGTSMTALSTCLEPQCQECGNNEYQDQYTKEAMCKRQPYCDPSKTLWQIKWNCSFIGRLLFALAQRTNVCTILSDRNFQVPVHESNKRTTCQCKLGFHCSTDECITCVPHTICKRGHGALSKGTTRPSDALRPF